MIDITTQWRATRYLTWMTVLILIVGFAGGITQFTWQWFTLTNALIGVGFAATACILARGWWAHSPNASVPITYLLAIAAVIYFLVVGKHWDDDKWAGLGIFLFLVPAGILALRRWNATHSVLPAWDALTDSTSRAPGPRARAGSPQRRKAVWLWRSAAVFGALPLAIVAVLTRQTAASRLALRSLWRRSQRADMPSAQEQLAADPRIPILLLRSFALEGTSAGGSLVDQAWHQKSSFEMLIVETLQEIGPVIAIGRPGDRLPPLGAAREYVQNGEWHTRVQSLIKQAGVIVVLLGEGEGLKWELNELQRLQAWPNTLVVVPPWSRPERDETWNTLITLAAGTQLAGTLSQADPRTTLLFMGDANDRITPVRCVSTAPSAYALAVKTALVLFARRAGKLRAAPTAA